MVIGHTRNKASHLLKNYAMSLEDFSRLKPNKVSLYQHKKKKYLLIGRSHISIGGAQRK